MSNSSLATYRRISPHRTSPRNHVIDTITIHCMAGHMTSRNCVDFFATTPRDVSSNYCIGDSGDIAISVDESDRSWCTSDADNDNRAITIEVSSDAASPNKVTDAAYDALIQLCTDICVRNGISKLLWKNNKSLIGNVSQQNMTVHRWFSNKSCPGEYLFNRLSAIASAVNNNLHRGVDYGPGYATIDSNGSSSAGSVSIDISKLSPYVAELTRNSSDVDFDKLSKGRYSGVLIELGDATKSSGSIVNPKLNTQISSADKYGVPYGLLIQSAVKSKDEVKTEIKKFSVYMYKCSPMLGVWVRFKFSNDKSINDAILDAYRESLELIGFKKKIGIYATKSDLSKISWGEKSKDWYLLLVNHVSSLTQLDTVLDSSFFDSGVK